MWTCSLLLRLRSNLKYGRKNTSNVLDRKEWWCLHVSWFRQKYRKQTCKTIKAEQPTSRKKWLKNTLHYTYHYSMGTKDIVSLWFPETVATISLSRERNKVTVQRNHKLTYENWGRLQIRLCSLSQLRNLTPFCCSLEPERSIRIIHGHMRNTNAKTRAYFHRGSLHE